MLERYHTTQQQRPESPTVTLTWHTSKYKVPKLHQDLHFLFLFFLNILCWSYCRQLRSLSLCLCNILCWSYCRQLRSLSLCLCNILCWSYCRQLRSLSLCLCNILCWSYCRQLRSLSLCLCNVFPAITNSLVCWFYMSTVGPILLPIIPKRGWSGYRTHSKATSPPWQCSKQRESADGKNLKNMKVWLHFSSAAVAVQNFVDIDIKQPA